MTREELKYIQNKHCIVDCEVLDVIEFVYDLVCKTVDDTKRDYPYAWKAIEQLENTEHELWDLIDEIDEVIREEVVEEVDE